MTPLRSEAPDAGPMRVMLATPAFLPATGGAERSADRIARGLVARGHHVTVFTRRRVGHDDPVAPYEVFRAARVQRRWRRWMPWTEGLMLRRHQLRLRTQIVLAFYAWPMGHAAVVSRRFFGGPPVVACPRGFDLYPDQLAACRPDQRAAIARGYGRADRLIAISSSLGGRAVAVAEAAGFRPPPVDAVPNGVDADSLRAEAAGSGHPLGGRPYALTLARLAPVKRHTLAVEAAARVADALRERGARLVFAGAGPERGRILAAAEAAGVADLVHLPGEVHGPEKAAWLQHAAVGLSCSDEEGMPNAVLEQLALGVPVLLSGIAPHAELLAPDATGLAGSLFDPSDAAALAGRLAAALRPATPAAVAAAEALAAQFGVDRMIDGYERSLRLALAGARR